MRALLLALCLLAGPVVADTGAPVELPTLRARVTDLTETLTSAQREALESRLADLERERGAQVAVLMLPSTQPETIEQFGIRLAEAWKIGRRGVGDGVIVIVAKGDRKMRIEVGYGLEGALPDAVAKRIIAEVMAPRFKQGDYAGGLEGAVAELAGIIAGEAPAAPGAGAAAPANQVDDSGAFGVLLGALAFSIVARRLLGLLGLLLAAGVAGVAAWMLVDSWLLVLIAVVLVIGLGLLSSHSRGWPGRSSSGYRSGSGGSDWSSGGSDSSWSSGSSDSGGFSGGGGDFGGGGASGEW